MNKKIHTQEDESEIIKKYNGDLIAIEPLAKEFKCSKESIREVLKRHNIILRSLGGKNAGSTKSIDAKALYKEKRDNYLQPAVGNKFVAVCKLTKEIFDDPLNNSGALSTYIKNNYDIDKVPTNHYKAQYFLANNTLWHEQYFDLVEVPIAEERGCKYCNWSTTDINNIAGAYVNHLSNVHSKTLEEFLDEFPEEIKYHPKHKAKLDRVLHLEHEDNFIPCEICGEKFKGITNTHVKKHGINLTEYKLQYWNVTISSKSTKKKLNKVWKKGLKKKGRTKVSKSELEIKEYIESFGIQTTSSDRDILDGLEIDIFIPALNIGIEFNGCYRHTELGCNKTPSGHLKKTRLANKNGIYLIHIFEDEWIYQKDIVKSKIKHIIGVSDGIKIGARKCELKEISKIRGNEFLYKFHIQGEVLADAYLGAYYKDELVSVMTFTKHNNTSKNGKIKYDFTLSRFATHSNYVISGIASRLLKFFTKLYDPKSIVSFADRRWSTDIVSNLYDKLGFKKTGYNTPNYWYYKNKIDRYKRFHRFNFSKNQQKIKGIRIEGTSEWECMQHHGWDRIWDCGLIRYVWTKN